MRLEIRAYLAGARRRRQRRARLGVTRGFSSGFASGGFS